MSLYGCLSVYLYVCHLWVFVCPFVYLFACLFACHHVDLHVCLYASVCLSICMSVGLYIYLCVYVGMSAYLSACVHLPFCEYICLSVCLLETYQRIEPTGRQTQRQAHIQIDIQTKMGNTPAQICSWIQNTCRQTFTYSRKCIVTPIGGITHVCLSI